ncbi:hypothetical protein QQX98_009142 [Neonectria punicea]|uniref:Aromatic amino acid beta-eliminating lyase/threonine aldolase domain-containing protein n=1 Tax=Neonectria punicea TaxID=979145 RepID=A0ABR1GTE8_9HYPO
MPQIGFLDDYSEGQKPYGGDDFSHRARECLRERLGSPNAAIYFVASGTLVNIICIASCLRPHEAVIAANTGHIVLRETGAIEATGHKIILVSPSHGKLTPEGIEDALDKNAFAPHMAKPRLVYLSNATEIGTIYTKAELTAISELCRKRGLILFLDGARLGAALSATKNDLTLPDLVRLTDIFWIGGTKVGLLLGEAIVINTPSIAEDFGFHVKQRGGLLAKGRVMGIQFLELFSSNFFFDLARHANAMAQQLSDGVLGAGYKLEAKTEPNQVFVVLPNAPISKLQGDFGFYVWEKAGDDRAVVRLVTSWATSEGQVVAFIKQLQS